MSCEKPSDTPANTEDMATADDRAAALLQFAEWDIGNLWQNCRAAGFTDDEIRTAIVDLAEREHRRHKAR